MTDEEDDPRRNDLIAYLDGELTGRELEEMERRLAADPALRREADQLKRSWELLDFLPQTEPSPAFASRTLERLSIAQPTISSIRKPAAATPTVTHIEAPRNRWWRRLAIGGGALAIFGLGLVLPGAFFKKSLPQLTQPEMEEQMARDLRVVDHLHLYQHGDDVGFVAALDQPDLFGEAP